MDNNTNTEKNSSTSGGGWFWTDERHVHFLNSMEATFVRTMYDNHARRRSLPLDRQLPDSFESTLDLGKHSNSDHVGNYSSVIRTDKKHKRLPSHHHDQVVPQLENRLDDSNLVSKRSKNNRTATSTTSAR